MIFLVKSLGVFRDSCGPKKCLWHSKACQRSALGTYQGHFCSEAWFSGVFLLLDEIGFFVWHHHGSMANGFCSSLFLLTEIVVRLGSCPLLWLYGCDFFARCFCLGGFCVRWLDYHQGSHHFKQRVSLVRSFSTVLPPVRLRNETGVFGYGGLLVTRPWRWNER